MIRSLTGFGRAEVHDGDTVYQIELRSVNNRYLEVSTRLPRSLQPHETDLRNHLRTRLDRGKVHLGIAENRDSVRQSRLGFDGDAVGRLVDALREAGREHGLNDDLTLSALVPLADQLAPEESDDEAKRRLKVVLTGLDDAIEDFNRMRLEEGANLEADLRKRCAEVQARTKRVRERADANRELQHQRMKERIEKYVPSEQVDVGRLEQEVAYLVDRLDVTEELVRLDSHVQLFLEALDNENEAGKRLNFILQEMNREVNTIGSKAQDAEIAADVVSMKEELEKMREQVQNVV
ncbi:YicC family protein [bacterium]|nr:YicC family protein [bacterium]